MKTSITRAFTFEAAHKLPFHTGKCKNLHGHSYTLKVTIEGKVNKEGMIIDFADLKTIVKETILDKYDHTYLNDVFENPTAEVLAHAFFIELATKFPKKVKLIRLDVEETATSKATISA